MARLPAMERELVGLQDAVRGWGVSERTLRRRLVAGDSPSALRSDDGSWMVPTDWLDSEFDRNVIDLRDPAISEGLAAVLAEISHMAEQVTAAEVRAAVAENEKATAEARLRGLTDELEKARAEHERLRHDYAMLDQQHALQADRLGRSQSEAEQAWRAWEEAQAAAESDRLAAQSMIDRLLRQNDHQQQKLRMLESLSSRRKRRLFNRLADEFDREPTQD
jgi:chromosome segregation ATPase